MAREYKGGFLRDDTGRIVVTRDTTGAVFAGGFLRSPTGALVISNG